MPEEKGSSGLSRTSAPKTAATRQSLGEELLVPTQDPGPIRIWFQRQSFRKDRGTTEMESTQLLEKDLVERVR